jgi:transcriptional regulator with XRE-family HTH domain
MLRLRVKEVAKEKGMSMNKLSQRSEVSYNIVKAIYRNPYKEVTFHTLNRLAEVLGVPTTALLEDVSKEQAQTEIEAITSKKLGANAKEEK